MILQMFVMLLIALVFKHFKNLAIFLCPLLGQ
jgi:hypothetical protein